MVTAACLICASDGCGRLWAPGGRLTTVGPSRPLPQGALLSTSASDDDGSVLMLKLQMTASAWSAAQVSSPVRDRLAGTLTPLKLRWVGAANTHTAHTMAKPVATSGMMMARPAGIRAR